MRGRTGDISEKIANFQPSIAQLNQAVERLRSNGQNVEADEILQLTSQYEMAMDKVDQESTKCKQAVAFRQNYATQKAQLEAAVQECEDEINEVAQSGMPIGERIERFKAITEKLQSTEPLFMVVSDKAQQLSVESGEDARPITDSVQHLKSHMDQLKKQAGQKTKQCDQVQKSRVEFDKSMDHAISWLEQKEDILASCTAQEMEPDKVMGSLQKHNALAREALDKIAAVKDQAKLEKAHYEKMGEPIPATMQDKLNQIQSLEDSIKEAIAKKDNYLEEAKTDRMQFEMSMKQINDWTSGAEEMLDSGYDGLDYDTLTDTLSEHRDYFSEASMCQDEMEQVMELSERLLPTLDNNDKETLRQTLKNTNKKLADVMAASQRRQQSLEKHAEDWQDYKDMVFNVTEQLQDLEEQWATCEQLSVANPVMVQQQLAKSKDFLAKVEEVRGAMSEINDKSHDLDKDGNAGSRSFINQLVDDLNDRYNTLTTTTENKQMTLQNLKGTWDEYTTLLEDVENLVNTADQRLPTIEVESAPNHELLTHLNETKNICTQIQVSEPKIEALKRCTENLQRSLPTAEAKIHTQEKLMNLLEKLERIQDNANEYHVALQDEVDDRGAFQTEADQTVQWLAEAKMELERLDPGKEVADVVERIEKQKVLQQEVAIRMDQMEQVAQQKKAKYNALGKDLPEELLRQIVDMKALETDVATVMKTKGEELQHIKADREEVTSSLKDVSLWLTDAELRLQDRIINIPDSIHNLQVLQSEFEDIKPVLDKLRKRGSDLIQHTPDSIEKQLVQKALADTNRQWLAVQGRTAERSRRLEDAKDLLQNFDEVADSLEKWLPGAESLVQKDATWSNFDTVKDQLKQQRKLTKDLDHQQDKLSSLGTISKKLDQLCDATSARDRLSKLNKRMFNLHSKGSEKLNTLEEINDDIDDYEDELTRLRLWMDETRSHLTMRDTTLTLKEQLAIQEKILEDIDSHKGKAMLVEQKQSELKSLTGKEEPEAALATEMSELQHMARQQCEELQESIIQQEQYESDIRHLSSAITEAQDKLLSAPVQAADVNTLKKQIAEHNALAFQIKSYQDKINDINEKSKHLSERSLGMRPAMVEKLSQMGYRYPSSLPSLKVTGEADRSGPDSGIFVSHEGSLNATQRSVSDADFSSSTMRSSKYGRSSDKMGPRHDEPGSLSGRSDDTDITIENYPGLFETMDMRKPRGQGHQQRSRSPSPFTEEKMARQHQEPVKMSSLSQPGRTGGTSLHRNVASPSLQPFSEM
ncbi:nesprin-1, partial [Mytilus galloprovincialis]